MTGSGRKCEHCGGHHRMMEICPEKPGLLELWRAFFEGQRDAMTLLAVIGSSTLLVLLLISLPVMFR